jgi:hypothetical protein
MSRPVKFADKIYTAADRKYLFASKANISTLQPSQFQSSPKEFPMEPTIKYGKSYTDVIASLSAAERKGLANALREVELRGVHASAEERRAAKLKRAAEDPALEPTVKYAVGQLRRLGLGDLHAAASDSGFAHKLDLAMKESRFDIATRLATKSALAHVGVLD